jgi:hypothetical protein
MAKVSLTKLGLKVNQDITTIDFNEQTIEVKQYLPINDKLELISNVINASHDDNNFANPVKVSVFTTLEIMYAYTNINFTDKQKEDPTKLYDMLISSGLVAAVVNAIPEAEYHEVLCGVTDSIDAIYTYRNSILGIMENIASDYKDLDFNAEEIQQKIGDPNNMTFLKEVLAKLG